MQTWPALSASLYRAATVLAGTLARCVHHLYIFVRALLCWVSCWVLGSARDTNGVCEHMHACFACSDQVCVLFWGGGGVHCCPIADGPGWRIRCTSNKTLCRHALL